MSFGRIRLTPEFGPRICFKDDVSSGPSRDDTSFTNPLQTILGGFGTGTGTDIGPDPATALPGAGTGNAPTYATEVSGSHGMPQFSFGTSSSFSPESSASSGVNSGFPGGASPFSSVANPGGVPVGTTGVFDSGAQPFQTFGAVGQSTGPGLASGAATGAPGAPAGVTSPVGLDPTQGGGAAAPFSTTGTTAPAAASSQGGSFLENLFSGVSKSVTNNPLSFLGAGAMAFNAYKANQAMKDIPSLGQIAPKLQEQAASLNEQGQKLASYLTNGNLPPGLQASLDQATKAAKSTIISNYASRGMNTDPTKNSSLAAELAAVDAQAVISTAQIGQQLLQTGVNETQLSSSLYTTLANIDNAQQQRISQSIANFAAALAPSKGAGGLSINLGKS